MNVKMVIHWTAFCLFLFLFARAGLLKIVRDPDMMQGMKTIGFDSTATLLIGWAEVLGVAGLIAGIIIPQVKPVSILALWPFAIGALTVHFSYHHSIHEYYQSLLVCLLPLAVLMTDKHFKLVIL